MSFVTRSPISLSNEPTLHGLPSITYIPRGAHRFVFDIPRQNQFQLGFIFPNFKPGCSDSVSVFLSVIHPYFHLLCCFILSEFG